MIFFNQSEITIYRRRKKGSSDRYAMSATFTAYNADIQPASSERIEEVGGRFGALFTAFVDANVDIKEGDQVKIIGTNKTFGVKGVQKWQGAGLLDHIELVLESRDA